MPTTSKSRSKPIPTAPRRRASPTSRAPGVNRISLGLQSFDDAGARLPWPRPFGGRGAARARGGAVGGRPRQLRPDLCPSRRHGSRAGRAALDRALGLGTEHLSLYQLTIEPGTRFATMVAKHEFEPLDPDISADAVRADAGAHRWRQACRPMKSPIMRGRAPKAATTSPIGATRIMPASAPAPMAGAAGMRTVRHKKPENFLAAVARNGHGLARRGTADPRRGRP